MIDSAAIVDSLKQNGFAVLPTVVDASTLLDLTKAISDCIKTEMPMVCEVPRGGVLLMKPLLLHSSSVSARPFHRRVIHFEFSSSELPEGLSWYEH